MPTPVEVYVRGLALCYVLDRKWNVHFVCDDDHPLQLIDRLGVHPGGLRKPNQNFMGEFIGDFAPVPFSDTHPPELFNLNGPQAHDRRLRFLERDNFGTSKILLKLPPSIIDVRAISFNYHVQEVGLGARPNQINRMATVLRFTFLLESDEMRVSIGDYDKTFPNDGRLLRFAFDNSCRPCQGNDSLHFYDIVIDCTPDEIERRFVTGEVDHTDNVPDHDATFLSECGESMEKTHSELKKVRDKPKLEPFVYPHGNCDPEGSDPPPNP
jgi:hypothetical protein